MGLIKKVDYYCGAFVSYLVSKGNNLTLFEATDNSKIAQFAVASSDFKVYIKYSATCKVTNKRTCRKWDINFTDKEVDILYDFNKENCKMYFVIVCTDKKMKNTEVAVLDFKKAMRCLGKDKINNTRRITIIHEKGSKYLHYYGVAVDKTNAYSTLKDFEGYFTRERKSQLLQG